MWNNNPKEIYNYTNKNNPGSVGKRASTYISAKLQKLTNTYNSLQFSVEMNTSGSKTPLTLIPFHIKYE